MFEVYEYYYDDLICYVETLEEAERICKVADSLDELYKYRELYIETADDVIAKMLEEHEEKIATLKERIEKAKADIDMLKACKEFLDQYLIGVDDFIPLIPEMYEASRKMELPISYFDHNTRLYYNDEGITKSTGERLSYAPIYVNISVGDKWFYHYHNGNYDIADDIMHLENDIVRYTEELNELLNGKE